MLCILLLLLSTFLIGCNSASNTNSKNSSNVSNSDILVHYINVGQGDSELIQVNGKNMLIDAGPRANEKDIISYLDKLKIKKLDYVIATHPHEDHIGNMDDIINKYEIGKFYAPKVENTTKTFENMVKALKKKNLKINVIKEGTDTIDLGKNTKVSVYSPKADGYGKNTSLNDYSPIIKVEYGNNSFLFTGDAEKTEENYVLEKGYNLKADVLKLGHHGSSTSTTEQFLKAVNPSIGIISCGVDNTYGHPHKETLKKLNKYKVKIYRTDKDGDIVLESNGTTISKK
nr:ComEC/Rec2 family competence protein [Clostridium sardiniense]